MEKHSPGQPELSSPSDEDATIDLDSPHEIAQRGQELLEVSKELTSSSKALLEQIEPIV